MTSRRVPRVTVGDVASIYGELWALQPAALAGLEATLPRLVGMTAAEARLALGIMPQAAARQTRSSGGGPAVGVLPISGVIWPDHGLADFLGLASPRQLADGLRQLVASPVGTIVLDVDSPGGVVAGVDELAAEIRKARAKKRIVASVNFFSASAAYWLASSADEIVISPSGQAGSIGVYAIHTQLPNDIVHSQGRKVTLIGAGKEKLDGNPFEPLGARARATIQQRVNSSYSAFTQRVALGRGVTSTDVRQGFGEGRVVGAREAVRLGMADRVGTFDQLLGELASGKYLPSDRRARASADMDLRRRRMRMHANQGNPLDRLVVAEVDPRLIPALTRYSAEQALAYCKYDLGLTWPLSLRWFAASAEPTTRGCYHPLAPFDVWLSAGLGPREAGETCAHEIMHAFHAAQPAAARPLTKVTEERAATEYGQKYLARISVG